MLHHLCATRFETSMTSLSLSTATQSLQEAPITSYGDSPLALTDIYQPAHNIAVWRRQLSSTIEEGVSDFFQRGDNFSYSHTLTPNQAEETLLGALSSFSCAKELSQDIAELVDMFCCLFDLGQTGLRLATLDKAMCPRFHVDHVPCRLVTTFVGTATEWLEEPSIDRSKLGAGNQGLPDHTSGLFPDIHHIQKANAGDVLLLKGERWEGNEGFGLVHRSPPVAAGEKRLLLTLDFS